jgi:hypothetical protein
MGDSGQRAAKSEYVLARERVEEVVPRRIERWGRIIGLTSTHARFTQFREDVTEGLHACMRAHIAEKHGRYKRFSDLRKDFIALAKGATAASTNLRKVEDILKRLPPMQHDPAFRLIHDPWATAFELDGLAKAARQHADECKSADRGGPSRMRAFGALAERLVRAYKGATGETGIGRSAREGRLLELVEEVLPTALKLSIAVTVDPLEVPDDLGEYLNRTAERLRGS